MKRKSPSSSSAGDHDGGESKDVGENVQSKRQAVPPAAIPATSGRSREERLLQERTAAARYIVDWQARESGSGWRFQKARQVWLLKNLYDADMVQKSTFKILLEYLVDLKGAARERLLAGAHVATEQYQERYGDRKADAEEDAEHKAARKKFKRALQIAHVLT